MPRTLLLRAWIITLACAAWCRILAATPAPAQDEFTDQVETVRIFFVQELMGFRTEAIETLAEDFTHYMSRNMRPRPHLLLQRTSMWARLAPEAITFDMVVPYTDAQGLYACVEHDLVPLAAASPHDDTPFQDHVVIARRGAITTPRDLYGTRWCIGGRRPFMDFFVIKNLLRTLLATNRLDDCISLVPIHNDRALMAEMRRDLIHHVLMNKADFAIVRRHELDVYTRYYPHSAGRLEIIPWLPIQLRTLEAWIAVPRARYAALMRYSDELSRMHLDPEGDQYLMLVGFRRILPIPHDEFFALTNYLHLVESLDAFVWP